MIFAPTREAAIVAVRIRLGWRGQPVLQIKRQLERTRFVGPAPDGSIKEEAGTTAWRDAGKADAIELAHHLSAAVGVGAVDLVRGQG